MKGAQQVWDPFDPRELADVLRDLTCPWWVAGGWALDLHMGRESRAHSDIDVLVLRDDVNVLHEHLATWDLHIAQPAGSLRPWPVGQNLPAGVHDIWCRRSPSSKWSVQVMVDASEDDEWVYRRDLRIRRPIRELDGPASDAARRVLTPEVQLLYKSRNRRQKDEADFEAVVGHLYLRQRGWLRRALILTHQGVHPWLASL